MIFGRPKIIPEELSIKKPFFFGLGSLIVALFFLAFFWPSLPPELPLFYSKPWGRSQLAPSYLVALPLILSALLLFANSIFAQAVDGYPLIKKMLIFGATSVCVLATITVIRIILLVV